MGLFLLEATDGNRVDRGYAKNSLMYRCHDLIFPIFGTPTSASTPHFEISGSGIPFNGKKYAPNGFLDDAHQYKFGPRNQISDYGFNELSLPDSDERDFEDFSRKAVTWTVARENGGTFIDSGWYTWASRIPYGKLGTWAPPDFSVRHPTYTYPCRIGTTVYQDPYKYMNAEPWEADLQDFPWISPWSANSPGDPGAGSYWESWTWHDTVNTPPDDAHTEPPQALFAGNPESSGFAALGPAGDSFNSSCAYPMGSCFVTIKRGDDWEIFAAALFNGPAYLRRSGNIRMRYLARIN